MRANPYSKYRDGIIQGRPTGNGGGSPPASFPAIGAVVASSVDLSSPLTTIPSTALGLSCQFYTNQLLTSQAQTLLAALKPNVIRYLGNTGDYYNWVSNSATVGGQPFSPAANMFPYNVFNNLGVTSGGPIFDFVGNYGSDPTGSQGGDPTMLANLIANLLYNNTGWNNTGSYGFNYGNPPTGHALGTRAQIEIGNEQYNAFGGTEVCLWPNKLAAGYAANYPTFIAACQAVDTNHYCKYGIDLLPDNGTTSNWNSTLLAALNPDFVKLHISATPPSGYYDDYTLLHYIATINQIINQIKSELTANGRTSEIWLNAFNTTLFTPFPVQTTNIQAAIYLLDNFFGALSVGVKNVSIIFPYEFQDNTIPDPNDYYVNYWGDVGILGSGNSISGPVSVPVHTPMPGYWGIYMYQLGCQPGDTIYRVSKSSTDIGIYAIKRNTTDNKLALYFCNRMNYDQTVTVSIPLYTYGTTMTRYDYGKPDVLPRTGPRQSTISLGQTQPLTVQVPAYSNVLLIA